MMIENRLSGTCGSDLNIPKWTMHDNVRTSKSHHSVTQHATQSLCTKWRCAQQVALATVILVILDFLLNMMKPVLRILDPNQIRGQWLFRMRNQRRRDRNVV